MFKWLIDRVKSGWNRLMYIEDVVSDELDDAMEQIESRINGVEKRFVVQMTVTSDTKIRNLKVTMLDAITTRLAETNPEVKDITIKLDYRPRQ